MEFGSESSNSLADFQRGDSSGVSYPSFDEAWASFMADFSVDLSSEPDSDVVLNSLFEVMARTGHWNAASRMYACSRDAELGFDCGNDDCDHTHWTDYHCDNRVCPNCGEVQAAQTFNNLHERVVSRLDLPKLRFTTLTFRNTGDLTEERLDAARECFHRLRRRDIWRQNGGIYAFESPYQEEDGAWNLHIHVLTEGPRMRSGPDEVPYGYTCKNPGSHDLEEEECLICAWKEITSRVEGVPESFVVDVQNMEDEVSNNVEAANYILKYLTKSPDLFEDSDLPLRERVKALWQYHDTFHDANMVQTFGHCHHSSDHAVSLRWNPDYEFECPECGESDWSMRDGVLMHGCRHHWWELKSYTGYGVG